jgi:hypothetical protein
VSDAREFPKDGILWRGWDEATVRGIADRGRPVLLFVADPLHPLWPFHREIFAAMPRNQRLRALLHEEFPALYLDARQMPAEMLHLGAGQRYHIAILQNPGFDPLLTFDPVTGDPDHLVSEIVLVLQRLLANYAAPAAERRRPKTRLAKWFRFLAERA